MIWQIIKARAMIMEMFFFITVFALGFIWAFGNIGGLADVFSRMAP